MSAGWLIGGLVLVLAIWFLGRFTLWRRDEPGLPILMYHYLDEGLAGTGLPKLRVRPASFARQVEYLHRKGYQTIGFAQLHRFLVQGRSLPKRAVIITFDDGARECLTVARDILKARGYMAVVFPVSTLVGQTNAWDRAKNEPEIDLLSWPELAELVGDGWEVGAHTRTHADLTGLDDRELEEELKGAKQDLESALGLEVISLAYPYGLVDQRVRAAAEKAGYLMAVTTRHGKNTIDDDPLALKRIMIKRKDTILDLGLKLRKGRSTI